MLEIMVGGVESFDEDASQFIKVGSTKVQLEHSLISLSKWESLFEKPFLAKREMTEEEVVAYVQCMITTPETDPNIVHSFTAQQLEMINDYINSKQTATWFSDKRNAGGTSEMVTSELIYYWIFSFNIPKECETWHLNRLFTLIRVFSLKNSKEKKMSRAEIAARNRKLNAERRARTGSSG